MKPDADFVINALLQHNYLPVVKKHHEELPIAFSSLNFTRDVAEKAASAVKGRKDGYDAVEYRLTRYNGISRVCTIPHPIPYAAMALCIHNNWPKLKYTAENKHSLIKPAKHADGRLIVMDYGAWQEETMRVLRPTFGKKYLVRTDIDNFFPSVYSHAIPWALTGMMPAKQNKQKSEWYNRLDACLRALNRNETHGIAIGPATSNVVSEAILAKIDECLASKYEFFRYIDDYHGFCDSEGEAQAFLRELQEQLETYRLQLNIRKTTIVRLPVPTSEGWVVDLARSLPKGDSVSAYDAIIYLDQAVSVAPSSPDGSVLKYALRSLVSQSLDSQAKLAVLEYALVLAYYQPILLPVMESLFEPTTESGKAPIVAKLRAIAKLNAERRRSDGMVWALYYLAMLGAYPDDLVVDAVLQSRDCMGLVMLYRCGVAKSQDRVAEWAREQVDRSEQNKGVYALDNYWLLLYEIYRDDKIDNPYRNEAAFEVLRDHGVSFCRYPLQ